jgi:ABC-2 type transport system ATP-binding protein
LGDATVIRLDGLQKVTDQNPIVDIEKLTVGSGEVVALVGPAGSGKGALFDLLIGRSRPTLGTVRLAGTDPIADRDDFSRRVGVLFAADGLYVHRSPIANLVFHCRLRGLRKQRAQEVLEQVGLADQAKAKLGKLPPGFARRLAFGRAILHKPAILLLLEPFAKCDEATISLLSRLIREQAQEGAATLILTADAAYVSTFCDRVHVLHQGRIVESYEPLRERSTALPFKIPVRLQDKVALVNPADILFAMAQEGRAYLQTAEGRLPTQFNLTELEERLARSGFFRAHRGYLVNLQHVKEVIPYTRNSFSLILDDPGETEIPLSKAAAAELRQLLGY